MNGIKQFVGLVCSVAVLGAVAADAKPPKKTLTPEEKAANIARIKANYYKNTGGRVFNLKSGSGKVVFVNAQSKVAEDVLVGVVNDLMTAFAIRLELTKHDAANMNDFGKIATSSGGAATIFVVDDEKLPLSLVAYEGGWGVLNLAKLPEAPAAIQGMRIRKLAARTFAQTCGVAYGSGAIGLMAPVRKPEALDGCLLSDRPNPLLAGPIHKYLANFGVSPMTVATYRQACRDGWAPPPTNDVQKALWELAREKREKGPTNPMTIKPPKK